MVTVAFKRGTERDNNKIPAMFCFAVLLPRGLYYLKSNAILKNYAHYEFLLYCDAIWYLFQVEVTYKGKASVKAPVPGMNELSVGTKSYR